MTARPVRAEAHGALDAGTGFLARATQRVQSMERPWSFPFNRSGLRCERTRTTGCAAAVTGQAVEAGALAICWTNTLPNLPPWARPPAARQQPARHRRATPAGHVVLDMAMSPFSYGALAAYRSRGEQLPVTRLRREGRLTRDPQAIEASDGLCR